MIDIIQVVTEGDNGGWGTQLVGTTDLERMSECGKTGLDLGNLTIRADEWPGTCVLIESGYGLRKTICD